jgi:hypothetical protein
MTTLSCSTAVEAIPGEEIRVSEWREMSLHMYSDRSRRVEHGRRSSTDWRSLSDLDAVGSTRTRILNRA